jgi:hypothetical protein
MPHPSQQPTCTAPPPCASCRRGAAAAAAHAGVPVCELLAGAESVLGYLYDFGACWLHRLEVEGFVDRPGARPEVRARRLLLATAPLPLWELAAAA